MTGFLYLLVTELKAGMRVSVVVNEPLYEVEDVAQSGTERYRVTFSGGSLPRTDLLVKLFDATDRMEVHYTLDEAVAEFHRLERAESDALQAAYDLGTRRSDMAGVARELGWRG